MRRRYWRVWHPYGWNFSDGWLPTLEQFGYKFVSSELLRCLALCDGRIPSLKSNNPLSNSVSREILCLLLLFSIISSDWDDRRLWSSPLHVFLISKSKMKHSSSLSSSKRSILAIFMMAFEMRYLRDQCCFSHLSFIYHTFALCIGKPFRKSLIQVWRFSQIPNRNLRPPS